MKVQIPEQLKSDMPQTPFGKILAATPVVMAVVATMLAGLASSEMTRAQYDRALAAQQQSKAGDQWSFFQAKRLRGALQRNSVDLLQNTTYARPLTATSLTTLAGTAPAQPETSDIGKAKAELRAALQSSGGSEALGYLERGTTPPAGKAPALDPNLKAALDAVEALAPDAEVRAALTRVTNKMLDDALRAARDHAQAFDNATKPLNQTIDQIDSRLFRVTSQSSAANSTEPGVYNSFTVARLRYAAQRYEVEARLNQGIASLFELQVRKSNISAERHHARSQRFFFGMLAAQLGVIVSTFAMAARKRNMLWAIAAAAGLLAIAFAIYVYLYV
jgi:hypothetical protein